MSHRIGWSRLGVAQDPGTHVPGLQECLQAVLERSHGLMDGLIEALQASASPSRGGHAALDAQGQALAQTLCQQHTLLRQCFAQTLEQALYLGIGEGGPHAAPIGQGDLRWLDVEQVDTQIENALAQHEVLSAVQDVLPQVHACMAALMGWQSAQPDLHPLRPQVFVHALRQAMAQVLGPGQTHPALATQAATVLGTGLRQIYRELLQWLLSAGVEPAPSALGVGTSTLVSGESSAGARGRRTQHTLDRLRRLLQGDDATALAGGPPEFSQTIPAAYQALEELQLLGPLMQRLEQRARPVISTLEQAMAPGVAAPPSPQGHRLGRQLAQEAAALMLERFIQSPRLLPAMRRSVQALQPVLLRLARHDPRFFSEPAHPARLYLECITQRSLAYRDEEHPELQRLLRDLEGNRRLLRHGTGDAEAFAQALQHLQADWARREATQRARAEAARRALAQAQQRQALVEQWTRALDERLSQAQDCPHRVAAFLRGPWTQVLAQAQMDGVGGEQLQGYASVVDDLAWSVSPLRGARDRARLLRLVPALLATLRQGLALIDHPAPQMAAFFDELITHHEPVFDTREPEPEAVSVPAPVPVQAQDVGEADQPLAVPQQPECAAPAQLPQWSAITLPNGAWVDLLVAGTWVRAQLTWASPRRTLFMFISGAGLAHTLSRRTLERRRQQALVRWVHESQPPGAGAPAVASGGLAPDLVQLP